MPQQSEASIRIVSGRPTDEELAAVVAALRRMRERRAGTVGSAGRADPSEVSGLSAWGAYWYRLGARPRVGNHGWRASALPR